MTFRKTALVGTLVMIGTVCHANTGTTRGTSSETTGTVSQTTTHESWNYDRPTTDQIRSLQSALNDQGASLTVDGVMGPQTRAALRDYQGQNSVGSNGRLDESTVNSLGLGMGMGTTRSPSSVPGTVSPDGSMNNPMNRPAGTVNPGGGSETSPGSNVPSSTGPGTSNPSGTNPGATMPPGGTTGPAGSGMGSGQ